MDARTECSPGPGSGAGSDAAARQAGAPLDACSAAADGRRRVDWQQQWASAASRRRDQRKYTGCRWRGIASCSWRWCAAAIASCQCRYQWDCDRTWLSVQGQGAVAAWLAAAWTGHLRHLRLGGSRLRSSACSDGICAARRRHWRLRLGLLAQPQPQPRPQSVWCAFRGPLSQFGWRELHRVSWRLGNGQRSFWPRLCSSAWPYWPSQCRSKPEPERQCQWQRQWQR